MQNYTPEQEALAEKIANDINEGIDGGESRKDLRMAISNSHCEMAERVEKIYRMNNSELRLMCGELTSDEIRTIKAVLKYVLGI